MRIEKAKETLSARQRVRRTFAFETTDRVTIGYEANPIIHGRLCQTLGIAPDNRDELYQALGVDYVGVSAPYVGPQLFPNRPNRRVNALEGCYMRYVPNDSGGYWDFCDFPLQGASDELFARYPIPDPDCFDYDAARQRARSLSGRYALYAGGAGTPDIINSNGRIMGMEDVLIHLATGDEAALDFMQRRAQSQFKVLERTLEACKGYIDFVWLGEDLGSQHAPLISLALYRQRMKGTHQMFVDLAWQHGLPVMIHSCGSSSWVYEDWIAMGVTGVDSLQPEARDMDARTLVQRFGGRLTLRGLISTGGPLAFGTREDITACVRDTLATVMPVRGYHFAPAHALQDNTPVANIVAMYQAAHQYGIY